MRDIRQSDKFAQFMNDLGWAVEKIENNNIYLRKFPFLGYFAKMPRPKMPLEVGKVLKFMKSKKIFTLNIAPNICQSNKFYQRIKSQFLESGLQINIFPFNPTTTIQIDLTKPEKEIFASFSSAKRRAVRRALKNNIVIRQSDNIDDFIRIRKKQYFPLGFLMVPEMKSLWKNFYPKHASLLLAYRKNNLKPLAGILLLLYDKIAYYWLASSLPEGKKLFAPTLLVWEALKFAKKRGCKIFDFEGIVDERFPKASESWKGFTKFKEGFAGEKVIYMENFQI